MNAISDETVLLEKVDGVAIITFNRPNRGNAWTRELGERYFDILEETAHDPEVRVLIVTGAGNAFCVGADMEDLHDTTVTGIPHAATRSQVTALFHPKPIIAAINGSCAGIGLLHAMTCDVRFAAPGSKITTAFARRGLIAEHGISWLLPRLVGRGHASDLLLSGRIVLAEEAASMGLVNFLTSPTGVMEAAQAYAADIAKNVSPAAMMVIKRQLRDQDLVSLGEAMRRTDVLMHEALRRADFTEGVESFLGRREPRFRSISLPLEVPHGQAG